MKQVISKIKSTRWPVVLLLAIVVLATSTESCKSTGKMSKKERKSQIELSKKQLQGIINGSTTLSLPDQEKLVSEIINKRLNDPTVNDMIIQAQQTIKKAYAEQDKLHQQKVDAAKAQLLDMLLNTENKSGPELQKELDAIKAQKLNDSEITDLTVKVQNKIDGMTSTKPSLSVRTQLENAFQGIADSAKAGKLTGADNIIKNTLQYFTDPDAPVLIIIYRQGSQVDYDKPTTIQRYLNFCRDQKKSLNAVDAIQQDASGKIKELDLIKK